MERPLQVRLVGPAVVTDARLRPRPVVDTYLRSDGVSSVRRPRVACCAGGATAESYTMTTMEPSQIFRQTDTYAPGSMCAESVCEARANGPIDGIY